MGHAYTKTPIHATRLTTTTTVYATVPVGKVWVLRQVICANASSASASRLRFYCWGTGGGDRVIDDLLAVTVTKLYDLRARMEAGEQIQANSSVTDTLNLTVTVWEFDA